MEKMRRLEKLTTIFISGHRVIIQNGLSIELLDQRISFLRPFPLSVLVPPCLDRLKAPTPSLWDWVHLASVSIYLHLRSLKWVRVSNLEQLYLLLVFTPRGKITGILSTTVSVSSIVVVVFFLSLLVFTVSHGAVNDE